MHLCTRGSVGPPSKAQPPTAPGDLLQAFDLALQLSDALQLTAHAVALAARALCQRLGRRRRLGRCLGAELLQALLQAGALRLRHNHLLGGILEVVAGAVQAGPQAAVVVLQAAVARLQVVHSRPQHLLCGAAKVKGSAVAQPQLRPAGGGQGARAAVAH